MKFSKLLPAIALVIAFLPAVFAQAHTRQIAGPPGESFSVERDGFVAIATTDETIGTLPLVVSPGETVTYTYRSGGGDVVVTIVPQPGENDDSVTIRLAKRVRAVQKSFPPDPAPPPAPTGG